jgi:hypothetical protein
MLFRPFSFALSCYSKIMLLNKIWHLFLSNRAKTCAATSSLFSRLLHVQCNDEPSQTLLRFRRRFQPRHRSRAQPYSECMCAACRVECCRLFVAYHTYVTLSVVNIALCLGAVVYSMRMLSGVNQVLRAFASSDRRVSCLHFYAKQQVTAICRSCHCAAIALPYVAKPHVR